MRLTAAALLYPALLVAQQPNLHIEVFVHPTRVTSRNDSATQRLSQRNFQVRVAGQPVPIRVSSKPGAYPMHLLILDADPAQLAAHPETQAILHGAEKLHWDVQLASTAPANAQKAIAELAKQTGRRVIVFASLPTRPEFVFAREEIPEIYLVDGGAHVVYSTGLLNTNPKGFPEGAVTDGDYTIPCHTFGTGMTSANDICNMQVSTPGRKSGFRGGLFHEKNLRGAINDLLYHQRYYDIAVQQPTSPNAPVHLILQHVNNISIGAERYFTAADNLATTQRDPNEPGSFLISGR